MSIDAIMVVRPRSPELLRGVLDPDVTHADILPDGTLLVSTFARFAAVEADPEQGVAILSAYGPRLLAAHDEPRGFFFFPDVCEPRARTYEALLAEVGAAGVWVPARVYTEEESAALMQAQMEEVDRIMMYAQALQAGESEHDEEALVRHADSPEITAEKLRAQMADILGAGVNLEALTAAFAGGSAVFLLMRPSKERFTLERGMLGVNESFVLADGTVVVHTDRGGDDKEEMVALALGEARGLWADLHTDARGVPVFSSNDLELVRDAASYEEALARVGAGVTFVVPKSMDEILAEKKAAFAAFLGRK
jgi:hypothetical protein